MRIGVSGPLSGANAFAGKDNENGVRLAVEELNAQKIKAGGKVLRRPGLGTLAVGAPADLVLHDLSAPSWVPLNDPLAQVVFGASGATVDTVIVDGRLVVENGKITAFDMQPVLDEVRGLVRRQRARNSDLQRWAARMEELVP